MKGVAWGLRMRPEVFGGGGRLGRRCHSPGLRGGPHPRRVEGGEGGGVYS